MLMAGVSLVDISPKQGVKLAGYPHSPRPNKGVHDPLYASCLYLNDGVTDVVMVTMDLLFFGKTYVKKLRQMTGKNIMFSATHTHSGPWASESYSVHNKKHLDIDYVDTLLQKLCGGIQEAIANTFPASLGTYSGRCGTEQGVGGNRRNKDGLSDPSVNVVAVKDEQDDIRAVLVNYTLHPTYLHEDNEFVSADYPGYIRRYLQFAYPKAIMLFAQGTSGNQSSRYFRVGQNFEEAARVGTTIGVEVYHCLHKMTYSSEVKIKLSSEEIELPTKTFPSVSQAEEEVRIARSRFEELKDAEFIDRWNAELKLFGAESTLNYAKLEKEGFVSSEMPYEVQVLLFDNETAIVGLQGEVFVEFGLQIKELSPYSKTFVFTTTNGSCTGYMYTPEALAEGGYEIGTSMLAPTAGEVVVNKVKEML